MQLSSFFVFAQLFNEGPYGFQMRFHSGSLEEFYRPAAEDNALLAERRHWITETPSRCVAALPDTHDLLQEFISMPGIPQSDGQRSLNPVQACAWLGGELEPDFLLLRPAAERGMQLAAGCVCFPSSWGLEEKIGLPMADIHAVVPGLNNAIGRQTERFLDRLRPGISWERTNWGLSRSGERNQHPSRNLPRLDESVPLDEVFLRVEHQSLASLPRSGGVLFGIRISTRPLTEVMRVPEVREGLIRALQTMPEEMAVYKNLAQCRQRILRFLQG